MFCYTWLGSYFPALHWSILCPHTASVRPPVHLGVSRAHPVFPTNGQMFWILFYWCFSLGTRAVFKDIDICRLGILRPLSMGNDFMDHRPISPAIFRIDGKNLTAFLRWEMMLQVEKVRRQIVRKDQKQEEVEKGGERSWARNGVTVLLLPLSEPFQPPLGTSQVRSWVGKGWSPY